MDAHSSHARSQFLERLSVNQPPRALIDLLRQVGVTREMVAHATRAKSPEVVSNWRLGRTAPRPEQYERLDGLRVVVSYLLRTNALDDDGLAIAMWLNSYPATRPFSDDLGRPLMTPLDALARGELHPVVDAAQEWAAVQQRWADDRESSETGEFWTPAQDPR